ncbi:MAG: TlpA family protein disulfide reductase [Planctomycetes bacterium]|nr:TlpA family protein disulfide reductase [Planctomycetota bacterium]
MIPHERSLVEKYKDRPFAIVGVNTDAKKDGYAKEALEHKVTWRNAWTGSPENELSRRFRVRGYPTVLLLDGTGKIREKWLGAPTPKALEKAIEELLAEFGESAK